MTRSDLLIALRQTLDDKQEPFLWETSYLTLCLDQSIDEACIRGSLIRATATQAVTAGTAEYAMPTAWYLLIGARDAERRPVEVLSRTVADEKRPNWETVTGAIDAVVTDIRTGYFSLAPVPDTDHSLYLEGYRTTTGSERLSASANTPIAAIPASKHMDLIHWAACLAYQTRDSDAGALDRSQIHAEKFERAFGPQVSANLLALRHRVRGHRVKGVW